MIAKVVQLLGELQLLVLQQLGGDQWRGALGARRSRFLEGTAAAHTAWAAATRQTSAWSDPPACLPSTGGGRRVSCRSADYLLVVSDEAATVRAHTLEPAPPLRR